MNLVQVRIRDDEAGLVRSLARDSVDVAFVRELRDASGVGKVAASLSEAPLEEGDQSVDRLPLNLAQLLADDRGRQINERGASVVQLLRERASVLGQSEVDLQAVDLHGVFSPWLVLLEVAVVDKAPLRVKLEDEVVSLEMRVGPVVRYCDPVLEPHFAERRGRGLVNEGLEVAVDGLILSLLRPNVLAKPLVRVRDEVGGDGVDELLEEERAKEVHCIHAWGITLNA